MPYGMGWYRCPFCGLDIIDGVEFLNGHREPGGQCDKQIEHLRATMPKLVIWMNDERKRLTESDSNVTELQPITGVSLRLGLEEYGRDWARMFKDDIVMLVTKEDSSEGTLG